MSVKLTLENIRLWWVVRKFNGWTWIIQSNLSKILELTWPHKLDESLEYSIRPDKALVQTQPGKISWIYLPIPVGPPLLSTPDLSGANIQLAPYLIAVRSEDQRQFPSTHFCHAQPIHLLISSLLGRTR